MKTIDIEKRRKVMQRSQELGHCICDTRRPCPCDVFVQQSICPCAGERPEAVDIAQVRLTELVHNAGCASKIAPADLEAVLSRLPAVNDPAVISGLAASDDAAIYRIAEDLWLVQTVDVFTPCVDDPFLFGRICAANCLSDIYAMGGLPRTALSVLCFPSETLPGEIMRLLLAGAMQTFTEAGVALIGGHSTKDSEIKLGFAITGTIDPQTADRLDRPQPGDWLVLTKPLGTGVLSFAQQVGRPREKGMADATHSMLMLNQEAAEAMKTSGATAATDITGFGLFGHLVRMLRQKRLSATIFADALPAFDGALESLRAGVIPGAVERNREFVGSDFLLDPAVETARAELGFDAQTSGGLLIAVPPANLGPLRESLNAHGTGAFVIGRIGAETEPRIMLKPGLAADGAPAPQPATLRRTETAMKTPEPSTHGDGCCADIFQAAAGANTTAESQRAYAALLRSVQDAGALSAKEKELILFSLVVYSRCQPCFEAHVSKARKMGITQAELDEAAWCAIAMGGAPVRLFYQECLSQKALVNCA